MLVRGDAFREVGGFDPRIFLYMEDVDLCRRLREAGWMIRYEPAATVYHRMAGSQGISSVRRWYQAVDAHLAANSGTGRARAAALVAGFGMAVRGAAYTVTYGGDSRQAIRMRVGARVALDRAIRRDVDRH
jgi:GT2 family glycosyltransferase